MAKIATILSLVFVTATATAQDTNRDGRITYLVPIAFSGTVAGARGTVWRSEVWMRNERPPEEEGGTVLLRPCFSGPVMIGCGAAHSVNRTEQLFDFELAGAAGAALYHVRADATWRLSARLFETSRHTQPDGVNIPVVREDRFLRGSARLLAVPLAGRRAAVRVYDPRRRGGTAARVEITALDGRVIAEAVVPFTRTVFPDDPDVAAILDLASAFPQLAGIERVDVRVTALADDMEYWTMASVTDNETQQVLLITPE